MKTFTPQDVRLEDWVRGPLFVADSAAARANKAIMERHFMVEWNSDIEATMATIHPDNPWQRIPALGVDINGFAAVRDYYLSRFGSWPGPAMDFFNRATVTDTCIYVEGQLQIKPKGSFGGSDMTGKTISAPTVIVVDCRDGLILGETIYVDGATILGRPPAGT
jgi:hypothetical protein